MPAPAIRPSGWTRGGGAQSAEADKRGISATENARRDALKILRRALKDGVDLRDVALYHLVTIAREYVPLSMSMAAAELQKAGLERTDAAVIAVVLADQNSASGRGGPGQGAEPAGRGPADRGQRRPR